jgi:tRNA threonylcarbamoyladenosine biosynthesis protein TsaB
MRILAIETSGKSGGIALAESAAEGAGPPRLIEEVRIAEGLRHGRDLVLSVRDACRRAGWTPREVPLVAVSIGPGSFTGIRIAVTFAKFVAWDAGAKVVAVPSFRALAANAPADRPRIVTIVDAKRGGLFASLFERREGRLEETFGPAAIEADDLARRLQPPAYVLGHGIVKGRAALAGLELAPEDLWNIRPAEVARLGLEMAARGEFADPLRLEPLYIRLPEAEELWLRRHPSSD